MTWVAVVCDVFGQVKRPRAQNPMHGQMHYRAARGPVIGTPRLWCYMRSVAHGASGLAFLYLFGQSVRDEAGRVGPRV